jgi:hypothetical protein
MNLQRPPKVYAACLAPGCTKPGSFARGMCIHCYLVLKKACQENGSWRNREPLAHPIVIEHWEFEGDENALAQMCEENERLRLLKSTQQHVNSEEENHDHV